MDPSPTPENEEFRCPGSAILSYVEPKPIRPRLPRRSPAWRRTRPAAEFAYPPNPESRTERDAAKAWLNDLLADGPLAGRKVEQIATRAGIAPHTLRRAREDIGVVSKRVGLGAGSSYLWSLPPAQNLDSGQNVHLDNQPLES